MQARLVPVSIREHFLADHLRMEVMFDGLLKAIASNDRDRMQAALAEFETNLSAHMDAEEVHLIPLLQAKAERDARVLIQEHAHIRRRLAELGLAVELHTIRLEIARGFVDEVRAHARSEDRLLYRWAESHVGDDDARAMLDAMRHRHPRRPSLRGLTAVAAGAKR